MTDYVTDTNVGKMTEQEAIKELQPMTTWFNPNAEDDLMKIVALNMAIDVLKKQMFADCNYAEWKNDKCLGFCKSEHDDEPIDQCKVCPHYESYEEEDMFE